MRQAFLLAPPPWNTSFNQSATVASPPNIDALFPGVAQAAPITPLSAKGFYTFDRTPYVQQWNLDVQRQLGAHWVFDLGYLGSKGNHINERTTPCIGDLVTPGVSSSIVFQYPNFSDCVINNTLSKTSYNALTARAEKRFSNGFSFQGNYTWSKTMSIGSATETFAQNYWDRNADWGPAIYNVPQRVVFSGIYELPFGPGRRFGSSVSGAAGKLIGGWQVNGLYQIQAGYPYDVAALDNSGTKALRNAMRANLVGNPYAGIPSGCRPTTASCRALNPSAFVQPPIYTFGTSSYDNLRGKGLNNLDFSLFKNTHIEERYNVQFRAEAFNLWNHTQLGPFPGSSITNQAALGVYSTLHHAPRVVQLALKIAF